MTLSFEGATAREPIASEGWLSVLFTHLVPFQIQMPPCAAPRMRVPSWRITSAPIRPLTGIRFPESRVGW